MTKEEAMNILLYGDQQDQFDKILIVSRSLLHKVYSWGLHPARLIVGENVWRIIEKTINEMRMFTTREPLEESKATFLGIPVRIDHKDNGGKISVEVEELTEIFIGPGIK